MISERLFAAWFPSFWRELLPFSNAFVRGVNSEWGDVLNDSSGIEPIRRSVLNESAVRVYCLPKSERGVNLDDVVAEVENWLRAPIEKLTEYQRSEISWMIRNLDERYPVVRGGAHQSHSFSPQFPGCGILSECQGDFLLNKVLVEVKSGFRTFRTVDFRQALTYAALNYAGSHYDIHELALYNARLDRCVSLSVDDLCLQMAGERAVDIFEKILDFASASVVSGV